MPNENDRGRHTPGPWSVRDLDTVVGPSGNVVAECCGYSVNATTPEQQAQGGREANARLIAAAPELLAALKGALMTLVTPKGLPDVGRGRTTAQQAALDDARAAIRKAEGGAA